MYQAVHYFHHIATYECHSLSVMQSPQQCSVTQTNYLINEFTRLLCMRRVIFMSLTRMIIYLPLCGL